MRKSAPLFCALLLSLSARRAWIEIWYSCQVALLCGVALRKESVDRNVVQVAQPPADLASLSARRAWIEIVSVKLYAAHDPVSLSARRAWIEMVAACPFSCCGASLSARRAWIEMYLSCALVVPSLVSLSARRAWIEMYYVKAKGDLNSCRSPQGERG